MLHHGARITTVSIALAMLTSGTLLRAGTATTGSQARSGRAYVMLFLLTLGLFVIGACHGASNAETFSLVDSGRPQAVIVLPDSPSWLERHAAEQLRQYVREISGATLPVSVGHGKQRAKEAKMLILIGRRLTAAVGVSVPKLEGDAFVVRTLHVGDKPTLLILGGTDRATLYAIYHFLETILHVGFFWDGEHVPKQATVSVPALDCIERPYFPIRQNLQGCAFGYSTATWDWKDWKAELDWMAKMRFNRILMPYDWGAVEKLVYPKFGVNLGELTKFEQYHLKLHRRIADYAHQLGMTIILPGFMGYVPPAFKERYPSGRYIEKNLLYPTDPLFTKVGKAMLQELTRLYTTDHIYDVDPFPERPPAVTLDFATGVMKCLRAADPKAVWYASGWAWRYRNYWSKETLRLFLGRIPNDRFYVCDIWGEYDPIYRDYDYFFGKPWGFSIIHSYGGSGHLYGDVANLARRVKDVVSDPQATNCRVFYLNPELLHYNTFYFDLAARLGWNPKDVDLDDYIADYAARRYGPASAATMEEVWRMLADSIYGPTGGCDPFFHRRMKDFAPCIEEMTDRRKTASRLMAATRLALTLEPTQKDNPLYIRDMVDLTRQALAEVFNLYTHALYAAYERGDRTAFERHATALTETLDALDDLLSAYSPYHIAPVARRVAAQPGGAREVWEGIKNRLYTFAAGGPLDYQAKDFYELLERYQRPRFEAWLGALRENLQRAGGKPFNAKPPQLKDAYKQIEQAWVKLDVGSLPPPNPPRPVLESLRRTTRLVDRLIEPSAAFLLTGQAGRSDAEALADFHHSFIKGRPSPVPRPTSTKLMDDFNGESLDGIKWHRWQGDPNIGPFEVSPNLCLDGAAVIRNGVATGVILRGETFAVEFLGRFVNPYPDSASFTVFAPETGETITLYHQAGGPYGTTVSTTPDGERKSTFDGVGGGQDWHLYRIKKTSESVVFSVDRRKVAERKVTFRGREWCIGICARSWAPYRGHTALVLDWVACKQASGE